MKNFLSKIKERRALCQCLQGLLALMLVLVFLSFSVFAVLAFRPLYYLDIRVFDIEKTSGYSAETIIENYDALIDYNLPLHDGELVFPSLAMSEHGRQHFAEVKDIFDAFKILFLILAPLCALMMIAFVKMRERGWMLYTGVLCVALPLLGGGLIALNWDEVFVKFHKLFFNNDYWLFDPRTDPVITILPDGFFMHCAIAIIALTLLCGGICAGIWFYKRAKERRTEKTGDGVGSIRSKGE